MRPLIACCVLSLAVLTACPEHHRRGGRIDRAAHQDSMESLRGSCSVEDRKQFCGPGREDSEECRRECGG